MIQSTTRRPIPEPEAAGRDHMVDLEEPSAESKLLVGKMLCGKWRIERLIGSGGMGAVYEATHRNGLKVAVKVLQAERAASSRVRARFVREGYVANKVGHSGVVAVLDDDIDEDTGAVFLVMELLFGETLAQRAERAVLPLEAVLRVTESILEVLAAAHDKGIVHRDVKPENVFVTRHGGIKLLDFGLARVRERDGQPNNNTESGAALGTLGFMAPEQARGRWDLVDGRTDVWAVGALMFRLLSGRPVHRAKTPNELLIAAATEPAPSVAAYARELPAKVIELVDRALAFEKERRWPAAHAMLVAVRAALVAAPPELMSRSYAGAAPSAGTDSEKTNTAVTGEPAEVSSRALDFAARAGGDHEKAKLGRRRRWLLAAAGMTAMAATFGSASQARRVTEPIVTRARSAPLATGVSNVKNSPARSSDGSRPLPHHESAAQSTLKGTPAALTVPPSTAVQSPGVPRRVMGLGTLGDKSARRRAVPVASAEQPAPVVESRETSATQGVEDAEVTKDSRGRSVDGNLLDVFD